MEPSKQEGFAQFLQGLATGPEGSQRKNSPIMLSPLPPAAPPPSTEAFKKKNRHVKTSSQPVKLDTAVLRREHEKAQAELKKITLDGSSESKQISANNGMGEPGNDSYGIRPKMNSEEAGSIHSIAGSVDSAGNGATSGEIKTKRSTVSFSKRLQKLTLSRSATDKSSVGSRSPRPRSPSKDSTLGSLLRGGNKLTLAAKLGFGKSTATTSKRNSDEKEGELEEDSIQDSLNTTSSTIEPKTSSAFELSSDGRRNATSPPLIPSALTHSISVSAQGPHGGPHGGPGGFRRSSAPSSNIAVDSTTPQSQPNGAVMDRKHSNLSVEATKDKAAGGASSTGSDLSPVFMQDKNNTLNPLQLEGTISDGGRGSAASSSQQMLSAQRMEETIRLKREHVEMEKKLAGTEKGALIVAQQLLDKTNPSGSHHNKSSKPSNNNLSNGEIVGASPAELATIANLSLVVANNKRLAQLSKRMDEYDRKFEQMMTDTSRVREAILSECRKLVQLADDTNKELHAAREDVKQKELHYTKTNTMRENELKWLDEKIDNALVPKEKVFRDKLNEAETKMHHLAHGHIGAGENGWFMAIVDHGTHATMELILLGSGTIISLIWSIIVWIKFIFTCAWCSRKKTVANNVKSRKSSGQQKKRSF